MTLNLRQKSLIFVGLSVTAILALYAVVGEYYLRQNEKRIEDEELIGVKGTGEELNEFWNRGVDKLESIATLPGLVYGLQILKEEKDGRHLPAWTTLHYLFFQSYEFTDGVYLLNETGRVLWSEPPDIAVLDTTYEPYSIIRDSITNSTTGRSRTVWRSPDQTSQILLSVPLQSDEGQLIGYLVGAMPVDHSAITTALSRQFSTSGNVQLVDDAGSVIISASGDESTIPYREEIIKQRKHAAAAVFRAGAGPNDRLVAYSVLDDDNWIVTTDEGTDIAFGSIRDLRKTMIGFGILLASVALAALHFSTRSVTRPIEELTEDARRIATGDLSGGFKMNRTDEIGILANTLDEMKSKLKSSYAMLYQSERAAVMGTVVAGIAHELNNPLTVVLGQIQLLMMKEPSAALRDRLAPIKDAADRSSKIVRNLLTFSRQKKPERQRTDVNSVLTKTLELRIYELKVSNIRVVTDLDPSVIWTMADPHQIQQVFLNLIVNAEQAMADAHGKGLLRIRTFATEGKIYVTFTDDGPGISQENMQKIFDPFFTTKPVGKGTGLGLSICQGIMAEHGGSIRVTTTGIGTEFTLELPIDHNVQEAEASSASALVPQSVEAAGRKNILFVDDEPNVRAVAKEILETEGYCVETAENGRTALSLIEAKHFDLIISDLKMSEVSGTQLYAALKSRHADLCKKMLFMSGDLMNSDSMRFLETSGVPWLEKPFDIRTMQEKVRQLLA